MVSQLNLSTAATFKPLGALYAKLVAAALSDPEVRNASINFKPKASEFIYIYLFIYRHSWGCTSASLMRRGFEAASPLAAAANAWEGRIP